MNILESAPGRPQRTASTKVPEASEPTESGTAEPKVEDKTEDKDVPDASARRAEKPTLAAPATPAAKVDLGDVDHEGNPKIQAIKPENLVRVRTAAST